MSITNLANFARAPIMGNMGGGLVPQQPVGVNQVLAGPQNLPGVAPGLLDGLNVNLGAINQTNDLGTLIGAANAVKAPNILGPNGLDLGDSNSNALAQLLSQSKVFTADTAGITGSVSPIQQTLGQLNKTLTNAGTTTPLSININDFKQVNGQPDPSALASTQAILGVSSLKGNVFFDPSSNARIKGRPDPNANPLAALLGGAGITGAFSGAGSDQQLGGLGQGILQLLSQAASGGGVAPQAQAPEAGGFDPNALMALFGSLLASAGGGVTPQQ